MAARSLSQYSFPCHNVPRISAVSQTVRVGRSAYVMLVTYLQLLNDGRMVIKRIMRRRRCYHDVIKYWAVNQETKRVS